LKKKKGNVDPSISDNEARGKKGKSKSKKKKP